MKICSKCGIEKPLVEFSPHLHHKDGKYSRCKNCKRADYREKYLQTNIEAYNAYGGCRCACCGETEMMFLTLDHIHNDGHINRRQHLAAWLKRNGFPEGFQVLCYNCNLGKSRNDGICPHKTR